jgi:hypothetical protein
MLACIVTGITMWIVGVIATLCCIQGARAEQTLSL